MGLGHKPVNLSLSSWANTVSQGPQSALLFPLQMSVVAETKSTAEAKAHEPNRCLNKPPAAFVANSNK